MVSECDKILISIGINPFLELHKNYLSKLIIFHKNNHKTLDRKTQYPLPRKWTGVFTLWLYWEHVGLKHAVGSLGDKSSAFDHTVFGQACLSPGPVPAKPCLPSIKSPAEPLYREFWSYRGHGAQPRLLFLWPLALNWAPLGKAISWFSGF